MSIKFDGKRFHLYNDEISYVIEISEQNDLINLHFGARIDLDSVCFQKNVLNGFFCYRNEEDLFKYSLSALPQEYPSAGASDFRSPAYEISTHKGMHTPELRYVSHEIVDGKPKLKGLPALYTESEGEAKTLIITVEDKPHEIEAKLFYTVFYCTGASGNVFHGGYVYCRKVYG